MKRVFILLAISILLPRQPVMSQDAASTPASTPVSTPASAPPSAAAAIAAKEDEQARFERLTTDLQTIQTDNEDLHAKITAMETEIQTLRDAQAHAADNSGIQDELKQLADKIEEVDKKRLEDKDAISEEIHRSINELEKTLGAAPTPAPTPSHARKPNPADVPAAPVSENGYSYTIKSGDTLGAVVKAYNEDYKSKGLKTITLRQAMEANPSVNWARLRVGQKIIIPRPDGG
jgi:TolA-binding protein